MAVTGVLSADFQAFYTAVEQADVKLRAMESGAAKVEQGLTRMTESFSGRRVITEATMMAEVFQRAGGATSFTQRELERMASAGQEAAAKMRALGEAVPPGIIEIGRAAEIAASRTDKMRASFQQVGNESDRATRQSEGLRRSFQQFDGVLASMGVNVGAQVRGLEDIASASGKTSKEIGAFGTAGLIAGAAMAGWQFGRAIAGWLDLDKTIGNATSRLMGWGDVAAETAGAQQDTIDKAIKDGAAWNIKYGEAIQFNINKAKEHAAQQKETAKTVGESTETVKVAIPVISETARAWNMAAEAAAKADTSSRIMGDGIPPVVDGMTAAAAAAAVWKANTDSLAASLSVQNQRLDELAAKQQQAKEAEAAKRAEEKSAKEAREKVVTSFAIQEMSRIERADVASKYRQAGDTEEQALGRALKSLENLEGTYAPKTNRDYRQMIDDQTVLAQLRMFFGDVPGFAGGVQNFRGGVARVGERGPELVRLPRGASVIPSGRAGGDVSLVVNMHGAGNRDDGRRVGREILQTLRAAGERLPIAGAA